MDHPAPTELDGLQDWKVSRGQVLDEVGQRADGGMPPGVYHFVDAFREE
jgi:hypothetical protein